MSLKSTAILQIAQYSFAPEIFVQPEYLSQKAIVPTLMYNFQNHV